METEKDFREAALELFHFQARENEVYKEYLQSLKIHSHKINEIDTIPFLPIRFFKSRKVVLNNVKTDFSFFSSSTSGMGQSRHYLEDQEHYRRVFLEIYRKFLGNPEKQCILALLPSYLEREGSSLVYMVRELISASTDQNSGFFLYEHEKLLSILRKKKEEGIPTILFGVSFALLDLAELSRETFPELVLVETGGMKGRRREMIRAELHQILRNKLGLKQLSSEYGMTEMLSQAYALEAGIFETPPWLRVYTRSINDPFEYTKPGRSGGINVIDLANVESCAFLETEDIGRIHENGKFEVLGRYDHSEQRGCNLLIA